MGQGSLKIDKTLMIMNSTFYEVNSFLLLQYCVLDIIYLLFFVNDICGSILLTLGEHGLWIFVFYETMKRAMSDWDSNPELSRLFDNMLYKIFNKLCMYRMFSCICVHKGIVLFIQYIIFFFK